MQFAHDIHTFYYYVIRREETKNSVSIEVSCGKGTTLEFFYLEAAKSLIGWPPNF